MAFNELQLKVAAESAILAAHANLAKISLFAKSFSELEGRPGSSVVVPVYDFTPAADFVAGSNDYGTGTNEVNGVEITLDQHLVKSVSITDQQLAETGINWVRDTNMALADNLTRGINSYVFGLINEVSCPTAVTFNPAEKKFVADLYKVAADNDIPVDRAVVVLNPATFAKVLGMLDASPYGGTDAIRLGVIPGLYGFKGFVCSTFLGVGLNGAIIQDSAIGVASRYLAPATPGAYPESWSAVTDEGMALGARRFMDLNKGHDIFAMDALFGAKVVQGKKVVRLTAE